MNTQAAGRAYVGCSGWQYKDWRRIVYPDKLPQRPWVQQYSTLFDTVEINKQARLTPHEAEGPPLAGCPTTSTAPSA